MKYCITYSSASSFILLESHSLQVSILHLNLWQAFKIQSIKSVGRNLLASGTVTIRSAWLVIHASFLDVKYLLLFYPEKVK